MMFEELIKCGGRVGVALCLRAQDAHFTAHAWGGLRHAVRAGSVELGIRLACSVQ